MQGDRILKKSGGILCKGNRLEAYRFIDQPHEEFGTRWLLRRLKIYPNAITTGNTGKEKDIMNKKEMTINMNGGQLNFAQDNAIICSTQHNGVNGNELDDIIKHIMENLSELKKENADEITDIVKMARDELIKSEPQISRLRKCLALITPMFTIANGIPVLSANLQKFYEFINLYIH